MLLTLEGAIKALGTYTLPLTAADATQYLEELNDQIKLLALYREFFPWQYARSAAEIERGPLESYSNREIEFMRLIDDHLFPLLIDMLDGREGRDVETMPIALYSFMWDDAYDLDYMDIGWQCFAVLALNDFVADVCPYWDGWETIQKVCTGIESFQVNLPRLKRVCRTAPKPLNATYCCVAWFLQNTGNYFLDCYSYDAIIPEEVAWTTENIRTLAKIWKRAKHIRTQMNNLILWINEDPTRFKEVITLWNLSQAA